MLQARDAFEEVKKAYQVGALMLVVFFVFGICWWRVVESVLDAGQRQQALPLLRSIQFLRGAGLTGYLVWPLLPNAHALCIQLAKTDRC